MKHLTLFNTLSRSKEVFEPLKAPNVGMYTCGPTVYNYAHIGNLRAYVFSDILKRVLEYNNYKVDHVMNITDVGHLADDADAGEDKMELGAQREGKTVWEIAEHYTEQFMKDSNELDIIPPTTWCKATYHIQEQLDQITAIEKAGYTYQTSDGVYFDTSKLEEYGQLARLQKDDLKEGARVDMGEKKSKTDFALWKFSPKDAKRQMEWDSPWGKGFPGWHIECSAMSSKYLGDQFDIHTGGIDHISVHHPNEIAQAEVALGKKPWVKYWLHVEFLVLEKEKMAKSGEGFITLATLKEKNYHPLDYRYFLLAGHYRQQLKFSWEALNSAKDSRQRLLNIIDELREEGEGGIDDEASEKMESYESEFLDAINDDLNTPKALAVLWNGLRDAALGKVEKIELLVKFDKVLGLRLLEKEEEEIPEEIVELAEKREAARAAKDFEASDKLRDELQAKGYQVSDKKEGYKIKKV